MWSQITDCVPLQKYVPELVGKPGYPLPKRKFEFPGPRKGSGQNLEVRFGSPAQRGAVPPSFFFFFFLFFFFQVIGAAIGIPPDGCILGGYSWDELLGWYNWDALTPSNARHGTFHLFDTVWTLRPVLTPLKPFWHLLSQFGRTEQGKRSCNVCHAWVFLCF